MNSHEHCAALLDAVIDGALSEQETERVRAHLTQCPECQAYVSDALAMRDMFPGIEETVVPDGFAESVLSALPPQKSLWRTQWKKFALPLAACLTLVLLARGISGGLPASGGATSGSAMNTGGGMMKSVATSDMDAGGGAVEYAVTPDTDGDATESVITPDMDGDAMEYAVTQDTDMDGVSMQSATVTADMGAALESDISGAADDSAYGAAETPESEESGVFHAQKTAPKESTETTAELFDASETRSRKAASNAETPMPGASYDGGGAAPQAIESDTMPLQAAGGDTTATEGDTMPPQTVEDLYTAPIPEPVKRQSASGTSQAESASSASGFSVNAVANEESAQDEPEFQDEASPESVPVAVSFWTLSPDAAPLPESYAPIETDSGLWYALTPEQFDALRETLPESSITPMDADTLSDNPPPLRDRAPVYLFLPRSN